MLAGSFEAMAEGSNRKSVTDSQGLIISVAIISAILLIYFTAKYFIKEEEEDKRPHKYTSHRHHRHVIKKTA